MRDRTSIASFSASAGRSESDGPQLWAWSSSARPWNCSGRMPRPLSLSTKRRPDRSRSSRSSTPSAVNESGSSGAVAPLPNLVMSPCSNNLCPVSSRTRSSRGAPIRYANSSSKRAQTPWNVPIHTPSMPCAPMSGRRRPSSVVIRRRSSSAARSLKVRARIRSGATPCSTSQQKRSVAVKVLPVPGPAAMRNAPSGPACAAAACSSLGGASTALIRGAGLRVGTRTKARVRSADLPRGPPPGAPPLRLGVVGSDARGRPE